MRWIELFIYLALLLVFSIGLSFIWGATTQLDMMVVGPFMEHYNPDDIWCFPFFLGWFSVCWGIYDAYVRMFISIGIGAAILAFGMFVMGYILGTYFTRKRLRR